jgi:very-short-patch-repair endonuclease
MVVIHVIYNRHETKLNRSELKRNATHEEKILWKYIRNDSLGVRFRRQYGVGRYIVDFYCPQLRIAVELDGNQHYTKEGLIYDANREAFMNDLGIKTLRFENRRVRENVEEVVEEIRSWVLKRREKQ